MNTFQVVLLCIFGAFLVIGVLIFAAGHVGNEAAIPTIVMWGSVPATQMRELLSQMDSLQRGILKISYIYKDPVTFDNDFTEAIATDRGPDLAIITNDNYLTERNKLIPIPFTTLSDREVRDTFIQEADLFRTSQGYLALPFTIDPLVMYWNRNTYQSNGIAKPPQYWDEFYNLVPKITVKDQASNISKSAISLGEFTNISNSKELLATLFFQAGNPITAIDGSNPDQPDQIAVVLNKKISTSNSPAEEALNFYTQFADPANVNFSWNRSLPLSLNMFLSGDLANYFGFASELGPIQQKNPNLNFDVAPMPQPRNAPSKVTFGRVTGLALVKNTENVNEAYRSLRVLTSAPAIDILSNLSHLPPTRRDLLATSTPKDAALDVFDNAALQSAAWMDPNPQKTNQIFADMLESIKSGRLKIGEAIEQASVEIENIK